MQPSISANKLIFLALTTGSGFTKIAEILSWCNVKLPSASTFYRHQKEVYMKLSDLAHQSCEEARRHCPMHKGVSFDGSWSKCRNAKNCIVDIICVETKKIIDFQIISNYQVPENENVTSIPDIAPKCMEGEGLKILATRNCFTDSTDYYTHDGDMQAQILIANSGLDLRETFDPNHYIPTLLNKYDAGHGKSHLKGIASRLIKRFKKLCFSSEITDEQRKKEWIDSYDHYIKKEEGWENWNNDEARKELKRFLNESAIAFDFTHAGITTNLNEAFHSLKAFLAPKDLPWIIGFPVRMFVAVIAFNNPGTWKELIAEALDVAMPSSPSCQAVISNIQRKADRERERKRTIEYKKRRAELKRERINSHVPDGSIAHRSPGSKQAPKPKSLFNKKRLWAGVDAKFPIQWKKNTFLIEGDNEYIENLLSISNPIAIKKWDKDNIKSALITFSSRVDSQVIHSAKREHNLQVKKITEANIGDMIPLIKEDAEVEICTGFRIKPEKTFSENADLMIKKGLDETNDDKEGKINQKIKKNFNTDYDDDDYDELDLSSDEYDDDESEDVYTSDFCQQILTEEEEESMEEEEEDNTEVVEVDGNGVLFNHADNCYANAAIQVISRTPELSVAFENVYADYDDGKSPLKELHRIMKAILNSRDTDTAKLCRKLGFGYKEHSEPEEFITRILKWTQDQTLKHHQAIIAAIAQSNNKVLSWAMSLTIEENIDQFTTNENPEVFIVQICRGITVNRYSRAEFVIKEKILVNEKEYQIHAGIFHLPNHFISIVDNTKYDDDKKPVTVDRWYKQKYYKKSVTLLFYKRFRQPIGYA